MNDRRTPAGEVDVRDLLDPELRPALAGFELPPLDAEGIATLRAASFVTPGLGTRSSGRSMWCRAILRYP